MPSDEDSYNGDDDEFLKDCQNSQAGDQGGANLINHKSEQLHFFPLDIHPPHCIDSPGKHWLTCFNNNIFFFIIIIVIFSPPFFQYQCFLYIK